MQDLNASISSQNSKESSKKVATNVVFIGDDTLLYASPIQWIEQQARQ